MKLRDAKDTDMEMLYDWANDLECRKNAFCSNEIHFEDHKRWFAEKMASENTKIYIAYMGDEAIGQIRLDYCSEGAVIDYSVKRELRGNGLGAELLGVLETRVKEKRKLKLIGKVKYENIPSQKSFEKQGYQKHAYENYIEYSKIV